MDWSTFKLDHSSTLMRSSKFREDVRRGNRLLQLVVQNDRPSARMRHISRVGWFGRRDTNGDSRSSINHTPAALPSLYAPIIQPRWVSCGADGLEVSNGLVVNSIIGTWMTCLEGTRCSRSRYHARSRTWRAFDFVTGHAVSMRTSTKRFGKNT